MLPRCLGFLIICLAALVAVAQASSDIFEYRQFHYRPGELRILMDTAVHHSDPLRALSHSSGRVDNLQTWLLVIDTDSSAPLDQRTRIYGPLTSADTSQSSLSFSDGVTFTEEDRKARAEAGFVAFDHQGEVVKIQSGRNGEQPRFRLRIAPSAAKWVADGSFVWTAQRQPPGSEDDEQTPDHRYRMIRDANGARLFETLTGKRVDDRWLEQAFETYRGMKEMGNVRAHLSNDLAYLVCWVAPFWNRAFDKDASREIVDTFEWQGKTYDRKDWAFYFKRGSPEPVIFRKPEVSGILQFDQGPVQALVIDGKLHLLFLSGRQVVLVSMESGARRNFVPADNPPTDSTYSTGILPFNVQHLPEKDSVAFFATNAMSTDAALYLWNYKTDTASLQPLPTTSLFSKPLLGKARARKVIAVQDSAR